MHLDWSDVGNAQPNGCVIEVDDSPTLGGGVRTADRIAFVGPQSSYAWASLPAGTWYWRVQSGHGRVGAQRGGVHGLLIDVVSVGRPLPRGFRTLGRLLG